MRRCGGRVAQAPKPEDMRPVVVLNESSLPPPADSGAGDSVCLEMRVEELERRLKARTLELETEIRGKQRLRSRIDELIHRVSELEETAACLHREAVSATALSQELDETLRVAREARRHLASALEAERGRREAAEKELGELRASLAVASKKSESELRDARRVAQVARQKIDGHEVHIESLRAEVSDLRRCLAEAEKSRVEFESRALAAEEKAGSLMQNAEAIRREGVEAFERAREVALALQLQEDQFRREISRQAQEAIAPEPWQVSDEIRLLLWVAIGVSRVAAMAGCVLFLQN